MISTEIHVEQCIRTKHIYFLGGRIPPPDVAIAPKGKGALPCFTRRIQVQGVLRGPTGSTTRKVGTEALR